MNALQIIGPKQATFIKNEIPEPTEDEVLIKINRVGICGTDLGIYRGTISYLKTGEISYPMIPGHEWVGTVIEKGKMVQTFKKGTKVVGECHLGCGECSLCHNGFNNICKKKIRYGMNLPGAFSEYMVIPAKMVHNIPTSLTDDKAVMVEPFTVALYAVEKIENILGKTILVTGAGSIGLLIVHILKNLGAGNIVLVDQNEFRLQTGKKLGADRIKNTRRNKELEFKMEFDGFIDTTGNPFLLGKGLNSLIPGGTAVLVGFSKEKISVDLNSIVTRDIKLFGSMGSPGNWERAINFLDKYKLDISLMQTHKFYWDQAIKGFEIADSDLAEKIKVVITIE